MSKGILVCTMPGYVRLLGPWELLVFLFLVSYGLFIFEPISIVLESGISFCILI